METISLRLEKPFLELIARVMKKRMYMTKTEFIREAIRDKIRNIERQELLKQVKKLYGISKHKTSQEDLHNAREKAFGELNRKFK